jgi:hypothetical protein
MPLRYDYSAALRCIGQALEKQKIEIFDLKYDGNEFWLQCGDPNPPHLVPIELRYSSDDIETLDREGKAKRGGSFKMVDFDGLPETLRALGKYVDDKGGHLLRICNSGLAASNSAVKLEYETSAGNVEAEELSKASIYQTMMQMYGDRS